MLAEVLAELAEVLAEGQRHRILSWIDRLAEVLAEVLAEGRRHWQSSLFALYNNTLFIAVVIEVSLNKLTIAKQV